MASGRGDFFDEVGTVAGVQHFGVPENLQSLARLVIHEEEADAIVHRKAADTDHLPVAPVVGEADLLRSEHAEKTARAAAMLEVGPIVLGDGRQVEAVAGFDELDLLVAQGIALRRVREGRIGPAVVVPLRLEHGGREDGLHEFVGHDRVGVDRDFRRRRRS